MTLPSVQQTFASNGLGQSPAPVSDRCVVIGCSSSGTARSMKLYASRQVSKLVGDAGYGPGPQACALHLAKGQSALFYKTPSTVPGTQGTEGTDNATTPGAGNAGTCVITLTGAALDEYDAIISILKDTTAGTDAQFQISLDGGRTYGPKIVLGAAVTYLIPNTGITAHLSTASLKKGDTYSFISVPPKWNTTDLSNAAADLLAAFPNKPFGFIHIVGKMSATEAATVKTSLAGLEAGVIYTHAECEARGPNQGEDEDTWEASLEADYGSFTSERMAITGGEGILVSPIDGNAYMRPLAWDLAVRVAQIPVEQEPGRVRTGPMDLAIADSNGDLIGHDERVSPSLDDARFVTAFTIPGLTGCYVANGNLMAPAGSDFKLIPFRRVMDLVATIAYQQLVLELSDDVFVNRSTGFILEEEALRIENAVNHVLYERVVKPGHSVDAKIILSRDDDLLGGNPLTSETLVIPKAIIKTIENTLRFVNPALEVSVNV